MRKWLGSLSILLLAASAWAQNGPAVPEGTPLKVNLQTTISTFSSKVGDPFRGKLVDPVVIDGKTVIPAGATVEGRVTKLSEPRRISGKPTIGILPEDLVMPDGQRFTLNAVLVDTNIPGTDVNDEGMSVVSLLRKGKSSKDVMLVACNFTPVPREKYRVGVPMGGWWKEMLNSDGGEYAGSGIGNGGGVMAEPIEQHGRPFSIELTLPPLAALFLKPE